jgi:hypothetical protein
VNSYATPVGGICLGCMNSWVQFPFFFFMLVSEKQEQAAQNVDPVHFCIPDLMICESIWLILMKICIKAMSFELSQCYIFKIQTFIYSNMKSM